jgi:hypothetical protein
VEQGVFVISWAQVEIDGLHAAPPASVRTGAGWRWFGEAFRVDGGQGPLRLPAALGAAEARARAARSVRRLLGAASAAPGRDAGDETDGGLVVSDGRQVWAAQVVDRTGRDPLLVFVGALPPRGTELWIVRAPAATPSAAAGPGGVICFTPGTAIRTAGGAVAVEALRPGDRVLTRDDGPQEVLWTGRSHVSGARLHVSPGLRPVRFRMGALGVGRPDRDLVVSPGHRMLVQGPAARALYGTDEVLMTAADLVDGGAVSVDHVLREVTYVHLLLERHQVVWANGLPTESFHPGEAVLEALPELEKAALLEALPGADPACYGAPARRSLSGAEAAILRHGAAA